MKRALKNFRIINYMKFFFEFKKPYFWSISANFESKTFFQKIKLPCTIP